jgi:hypothetical protein
MPVQIVPCVISSKYLSGVTPDIPASPRTLRLIIQLHLRYYLPLSHHLKYLFVLDDNVSFPIPENKLQIMTCLRSNKMPISLARSTNYYHKNVTDIQPFSPNLYLTKFSFVNIGITHRFFIVTA